MDEKSIPSGLGRWVPQITVFVSSFCIMVIELVAGRIVSRHLGSSLYTWTSVIGIVLAGIAVGNYLGGRIADRYPAKPTLATLFVLASITCVTISVLNHQVGDWVFLWGLAWPVRVGLHVGIVFLLPSLVLGTISPVAAKMALDHSHRTGRTIGSVYAWGVVGSIVGTFLTGFYFIALFGTAAVVWGVSGTLALMALLFGAASWKIWAWSGVLSVLVVLGIGPWAWSASVGERLSLREVFGPDVLYVDESQYSHIRIHQVSNDPDKRNMMLDKLLHSSIIMSKPTDLQYGYERIYAALTREMASGRDSLNTLAIGGGGYVFPRYVQQFWPKSRTEVVEIDTAVTKAAIEAFGLAADHGLIVEHEDGRAFLRRTLEAKRNGAPIAPYDLVYLDALSDYSIPYQLTTVEFNRQVAELLAPEGAILMNMIDVFEQGRFLSSMVRTMSEVFPQVSVFKEGVAVDRQPDVRNTFIIVGSKVRRDFSSAIAGYNPQIGLYELTASDRREIAAIPGTGVLTDDWAPIENFLAPVVKGASREIASGVLVQRAEAALHEGDTDTAIRTAERALRFFPESHSAHAVLAAAFAARNELDRAISHYQESLRIRPAQMDLRVNLATAFGRRGRLDDAERTLREVLRYDPTSSSAFSDLGIVLMQQGRFEEAIAACRRGVTANPGSANARINLGVALFRVGMLEEAAGEFAEVLRIDPDNGKARQNLQKVEAALSRKANENNREG